MDNILTGPVHGSFEGVDSTGLLIPQQPCVADAVFDRLDVETLPAAPTFDGDMPLNLGRQVGSL